MPGDDNVVDAEFQEVKGLPHLALQAELDAAYEYGRTAASQGEPKQVPPGTRHEIAARWTQGWTDWHEENKDPSAETGDSGAAPDAPATDKDELYDEAVARVIAKQRASISFVQRELRIGYNRAARLIEQMQAEGIVSAPDSEGARKVLKSTEGADA
jgi:DNA segregation ATPase FtsK/SpoIIIE-like protein